MITCKALAKSRSQSTAASTTCVAAALRRKQENTAFCRCNASLLASAASQANSTHTHTAEHNFYESKTIFGNDWPVFFFITRLMCFNPVHTLAELMKSTNSKIVHIFLEDLFYLLQMWLQKKVKTFLLVTRAHCIWNHLIGNMCQMSI